MCLDWARVGAGQGNSVGKDKRVRLESADFDDRWLTRTTKAEASLRRSQRPRNMHLQGTTLPVSQDANHRVRILLL